MEVKYLSFGNLCLKLELPEPMLETEGYMPFFCDEKPSDFEICYSFCKERIFLPQLVSVTERGNRVFCFDGKTHLVYYKAAAPGEFYAVRECCDGEKKIKITLTSEAKGKLWARLVLNTLGIEELAARKSGVVFHSSFIERNKRAVLFTGPCGAGKSTQAEIWKRYCGVQIINGDKTLIYLENGKIFASGLPFSGSSGISKNLGMELVAIVHLEKSKENRIELFSPRDAFLCLLKSSYVPLNYGGSVSSTLAKIAERTLVCSLFCTPDERAAEVLDNYLKGREKL